MARDNLELVRRAFRAFNDRDTDGLRALYAEDIEWRLSGGFAELIGADIKGCDALLPWLADWIENLGVRVELQRSVQAGAQVAVVCEQRATGRASGVPVAQRFGQVYTIRDGQISVIENYYEPNDALELVKSRGDDRGDSSASGT
jgi:ketosteroid isomerase-like protein